MPSYTADVETYFPDSGRTAQPGDVVTVDDDGVLVDITTGTSAPEPVAEPTPDVPEES